MVDADSLARRFERELLGLEDAYVEKVRNLRAPAGAERGRAEARFAAVAESVKQLFEDMQLER